MPFGGGAFECSKRNGTKECDDWASPDVVIEVVNLFAGPTIACRDGAHFRATAGRWLYSLSRLVAPADEWFASGTAILEVPGRAGRRRRSRS